MQNDFANDDIEMLRLGLAPDERKEYSAKKVEMNQQMTTLLRQAREKAKPTTCQLCRQPCSSFCNSHSIPQFCLKRIAKDGKVYPPVWSSGMPLFDREMGVREAGTFQAICRECDSRAFQEYESPEAYFAIPSGQVLAQICMKNYLQMISKRKQEIELYKLGIEMAPYSRQALQHQIEISRLDLFEYEQGLDRAHKASHGNHNDWYYLCYFQRLDYVVPFAFQGSVNLVCGLNGEIINNIYNMAQNYHVEEIHIVVFPLVSESIVMMITDSRKRRYGKFCRQLKKLPLEEQLAVINYIIFSYSENVFISKDIDESVFSNEAFLKMCQTTSEAISATPMADNQALNAALKEFDLSKRDKVPNLLSKQYALHR